MLWFTRFFLMFQMMILIVYNLLYNLLYMSCIETNDMIYGTDTDMIYIMCHYAIFCLLHVDLAKFILQ